MKIFDIHVHIYPEKIAEKASKSIGDFYDGFEIHGNGTLDNYLSHADKMGIERFAAHSVAMTPHNAERINSFIMEAYKRVPDRLIPFAALHPDAENIGEEVDKLIAQGFRGVKIHPDIQRFELDGERARPMMEALEGRLPLLIHCGDYRYDFDGPKRIISLHKKHPKLEMICAHFGGWMEWNSAVELLAGQDLVVDCSSSLYQWTPEQAANAIHSFGADHVLYGTDYPMWTPEEELERFMQIPLSNQEREDILWNNAARLLKL